jgi:hypothetical protein
MFPDWLKKPEMIFAMVLWLTSPLWGWFVGRVRSWYAAQSESAAQSSMEYLRRKIEHPPTLVESLAIIICFLPLPITMAMVSLLLYFSPQPPPWFPRIQDPRVAHEFARTVLMVVFFSAYTLFGALTVHGIQVAFRLRNGAAHYADSYKAGIQKRIDKLKKKYPRLK